MNNRTHALLVIVVLALAVAPLRGALASALPSATDEAPHCMQMQGDSMDHDHMTGLPDTTTDHPGHGCDQGCGGDCCNGVCGACVHAALALPTVSATGPNSHSGILRTAGPQHFAGRTVHPPYRPPISLPG